MNPNETRKELGHFSNIVSGYARGSPQSLMAFGARSDINEALGMAGYVETTQRVLDLCHERVTELESDLIDARDNLDAAQAELDRASSELENIMRSLSVRLEGRD